MLAILFSLQRFRESIQRQTFFTAVDYNQSLKNSYGIQDLKFSFARDLEFYATCFKVVQTLLLQIGNLRNFHVKMAKKVVFLITHKSIKKSIHNKMIHSSYSSLRSFSNDVIPKIGPFPQTRNGSAAAVPQRWCDALSVASISNNYFWCEKSSETERLSGPRTQWVDERRPADPCFTGSMAHSTQKRQPSGDQTVTSVSYWLRNMMSVCLYECVGVCQVGLYMRTLLI